MEWTSVDVESDKDISDEAGGFADLKVGLDTDAESMHLEFMRGLPHLSDVQEMHSSVVSEIDSRALNDDCLLYTSPSPRDLSTSRMPSSA